MLQNTLNVYEKAIKEKIGRFHLMKKENTNLMINFKNYAKPRVNKFF